MNPELEQHQVIPFNGGIWNGDCWKAYVQIRQERDDLAMYVVDTDYGCGVIRKGYQEKLDKIHNLDFNTFSTKRKEWLNLITPDQFVSRELMDKTKQDYDSRYLNQLLLLTLMIQMMLRSITNLPFSMMILGKLLQQCHIIFVQLKELKISCFSMNA